MKKVGIIGATGYAGLELTRLLLSHKEVEIVAVSSVSYEGKKISEIFPSLASIFDEQLTNIDEVIVRSDLVFASLPHGHSEAIAEKCKLNGKLYIDLGADFRLSDEQEYKEWYKLDYTKKDLHKYSQYSIPELHRALLKDKCIVGNPGCYPTSISLGVAPLLKYGKIDYDSIIIDSKSGATGAGRGLTQNTHFTECNETFAPYKIAEHRHTPEIEEVLSGIAGRKMNVLFVPHLLPINRGIESTIYIKCDKDLSINDLHDYYTSFYKNEQFVRVLPLGKIAAINNVKMSNYCDISLHKDERTSRIIIVACIDNLIKGAAGQAIQNMNLLLGINENCGLNMIPSFI